MVKVLNVGSTGTGFLRAAVAGSPSNSFEVFVQEHKITNTATYKYLIQVSLIDEENEGLHLFVNIQKLRRLFTNDRGYLGNKD